MTDKEQVLSSRPLARVVRSYHGWYQVVVGEFPDRVPLCAWCKTERRAWEVTRKSLAKKSVRG